MRDSPWFARIVVRRSRIRQRVSSTQSDQRNSSADKARSAKPNSLAGQQLLLASKRPASEETASSEMKTCSARIVVRSPEPATAGLNNRSADPKPHTGVAVFDRELFLQFKTVQARK
jgi:hypothetical protein